MQRKLFVLFLSCCGFTIFFPSAHPRALHLFLRDKCVPIHALQGLGEGIAKTDVTATMELYVTTSTDSATVYQDFKAKR